MSGGPGIRGTWFVLPTPFDEDGRLDLDSQRRLVDAAIGWGVDGLTAMGVTSEAGTLAPSERVDALEAIFEVAGVRAPIVVGCSASDPDEVRRLVENAAGLGARAAMVAAAPGTPAGELPSFFGRIAEPGHLPLVIQDEPAATGVTVSVSTLLECLQASGSRTVKLEDPPTALKIGRLLEADPGLEVFGGLGGVAALYELRGGACGTMTGFAFPEILRVVRLATESGDRVRAAAVFDRFLPLIQFEAQPVLGLGLRKELLRRRGAIAAASTRSTPAPGRWVIEELGDLLRRLDISPTLDRFVPDGRRTPVGDADQG
ncbi:MAG: dihydrodipicolinate synthase family protein [Actinobacteria bacterium]|nr:dihydrodipicolinate synthase family protein [Actinomycetota bacterium]